MKVIFGSFDPRYAEPACMCGGQGCSMCCGPDTVTFLREGNQADLIVGGLTGAPVKSRVYSLDGVNLTSLKQKLARKGWTYTSSVWG